MENRIERFSVEFVAVFIALSAIAGGIGLVGGGLPFPVSWLGGTPFSSYFGPGLILAFIVGGSALGSAILMLRHHPLALPAAIGAGCIQAGWIVGEVILVGTRDNLMGLLQVVYLVAGVILSILSAQLWLRSNRDTGRLHMSGSV